MIEKQQTTQNKTIKIRGRREREGREEIGRAHV